LEENANITEDDLHFENLLSTSFDGDDAIHLESSFKQIVVLEDEEGAQPVTFTPRVSSLQSGISSVTAHKQQPFPTHTEPESHSHHSESDDDGNHGVTEDDIENILSYYNSSTIEDASFTHKRHTIRRSSPACISTVTQPASPKTATPQKSVLRGDEAFLLENSKPQLADQQLALAEGASVFDIPDSPKVIVFTSRVPKYEGQPRKILAATLEKLVEHLTSNIGNLNYLLCKYTNVNLTSFSIKQLRLSISQRVFHGL
jgi:hypothetical protein